MLIDLLTVGHLQESKEYARPLAEHVSTAPEGVVADGLTWAMQDILIEARIHTKILFTL
jgi:hypothetical protein